MVFSKEEKIRKMGTHFSICRSTRKRIQFDLLSNLLAFVGLLRDLSRSSEDSDPEFCSSIAFFDTGITGESGFSRVSVHHQPHPSGEKGKTHLNK